MSKTIELPHGIKLEVTDLGKMHGGRGATAITCSEMQLCPQCGDLFCYSAECEAITGPDEHHARNEFNARIEGMTSLIQNLYSTGFDHLIEEMGPAVEATMQDIANQE